ncbi:MAG: DUF3604 domain-containing protein [Spirochaetaceae bacterium]
MTITLTNNQIQYQLYTESEKALKRILLKITDEKGIHGPFPMTDWEKIDNPTAVLNENCLFLAWELYEDNCRIQFTKLNLKTLVNVESIFEAGKNRYNLTGIEERCYRPRLSVSCGNLLLCYEQFYEKQYIINGKLYQNGTFSGPFELGSEKGNNQEPWLTPTEDGYILSYENSSPLYKDYVWRNSKGNEVIIPAFGHGWRVETRSFLKYLEVIEDSLTTSVLEQPIGNSDSRGFIPLDGKESSGCPIILTLPDSSLMVLFCSYIEKVWHICYSFYRENYWSSAFDTGLITKLRTTPEARLGQEGDFVEVFPGPDSPNSQNSVKIRSKVGNSNSSLPGKSIYMDQKLCPLFMGIQLKKSSRELEYKGEKRKLLWGDLHMHTNISSCSLHAKFHCSELEEKYRQCHDVGQLDFAMVTDHDRMSDSEWQRTVEVADFNNRPRVFTAFQGFEWTATEGGIPKQGHYNVLYKDTGRLYRLKEDDGSHITKLWEDMVEGEVLTIPHHPADETHMLDWNFFDPRFEPLVEIFQVRGSYEYPGNSMDPSLYRPEKMVKGASILEALEKGYEFGFTSGGEHEGVGTTAVFATENTREAIFEALCNRHVFGTTGDHIYLDFRVNGVLMGGVISDPVTVPEITMTINGTAAIKELRIMRDGKKVFSRSFEEKDVELTWVDEDFVNIINSRQVHYYYMVVEQVNNEIAWASPVFIK